MSKWGLPKGQVGVENESGQSQVSKLEPSEGSSHSLCMTSAQVGGMGGAWSLRMIPRDTEAKDGEPDVGKHLT